MTTVSGIAAPGPRKKVCDVTVSPGTPVTFVTRATSFSIVAFATAAGAGTYSIDYSLVGADDDEDDFRPLLNSAGAANTGLSNGGTVAARTSSVASPGVGRIKLTATTQPTRFIAYGV